MVHAVTGSKSDQAQLDHVRRGASQAASTKATYMYVARFKGKNAKGFALLKGTIRHTHLDLQAMISYVQAKSHPRFGPVTMVKLDGAGEHASTRMTAFLNDCLIDGKNGDARVHETMGGVEAVILETVRTGRANLHDANAPKDQWLAACNYAAWQRAVGTSCDEEHDGKAAG